MATIESPDVEPSFRTQALQLLALTVTKLASQRFLSKLFAHSNGPVFFFNLCIKFGDSVTIAEANALRFVAKHTSIPVPKVYHAFAYHGKTYIIMERIRGETVAQKWRSLSETSKTSIFGQLRQMIDELRAVPRKTTGVANLDGGPIHDDRLPRTSSWGPFDTVHDFLLALRNNITIEAFETQDHSTLDPKAISDVQELVRFHESIVLPPVLTHGDLSSFNVLLRDGNVVGIIDWENAGWLPYYWEYTTAWHANPQNQFWQKEVHKFLNVYEEELGMEKVRRQYFGGF
ncbi:hypothetical protein FKW77_003856 [Venturia effusa]|uniref:Aminoglycoside phosphotransferase domain-containing protein n=1 Tax=Venturia effusa TaxID=50376 RepID=A0A517LPX4_9PEZI|nr:hypothetical protein FKW77_003856 [Venturia effusa]